MPGEEADTEAILTTLEETVEKRLDVQVLKDLIVLYQTKGDRESVTRTEAELGKVMEDTYTEIVTESFCPHLCRELCRSVLLRPKKSLRCKSFEFKQNVWGTSYCG